MKTWVTKFDEELLERSRVFLAAAEAHPNSHVLLEKYGFGPEEQERGRRLVAATEKSFQWAREGRSWNFLGLTRERRAQDARDWYADTRWPNACDGPRRTRVGSGLARLCSGRYRASLPRVRLSSCATRREPSRCGRCSITARNGART